jgi:hypothetical protein
MKGDDSRAAEPGREPEEDSMRELVRRCGEVLFYVWDPAGVSPCPDVRDEYDSYAVRLAGHLQMGADEDRVMEILAEIEKKWFGMETDERVVREIAALLCKWRDLLAG